MLLKIDEAAAVAAAFFMPALQLENTLWYGRINRSANRSFRSLLGLMSQHNQSPELLLH
jgi:hypothetical protein